MFYYAVGECFHSLAGGNRGGDAVLIRISELLHLLPNPRRHLFRDRETPTFFLLLLFPSTLRGKSTVDDPAISLDLFYAKKEEEVK